MSSGKNSSRSISITSSLEVQPKSARFSNSDISSSQSKSTNRIEISNFLPELSNCGRVCIVGGSAAQTGPPFFAAQAALICGADRVTILTTPSASIPIKCYSSSLTVIPYLPEKNSPQSESFITTVWPLVKGNDAFSFGPGLGNCNVTLLAVLKLILKARKSGIPIVLSSEALLLLNTSKMDLLSQVLVQAPVVLIFNENEFVRMWGWLHSRGIMSFRDGLATTFPFPASKLVNYKMGEEFSINLEPDQVAIHQTAHVGNALGRHVVVLRMGLVDITVHRSKCFLFGGPEFSKQCNGKGSLLAGLVTLFLAWQNIKGLLHKPIAAAKCADLVIRLAFLDAYSTSTRGVVATDVANQIPGVMRNLGIFSRIISRCNSTSSTADKKGYKSRF